MGKNTVQAKQWLDKCYSDFALLETMVRGGMLTLNDAKCCCPGKHQKTPQTRFGQS